MLHYALDIEWQERASSWGEDSEFSQTWHLLYPSFDLLTVSTSPLTSAIPSRRTCPVWLQWAHRSPLQSTVLLYGCCSLKETNQENPSLLMGWNECGQRFNWIGGLTPLGRFWWLRDVFLSTPPEYSQRFALSPMSHYPFPPSRSLFQWQYTHTLICSLSSAVTSLTFSLSYLSLSLIFLHIIVCVPFTQFMLIYQIRTHWVLWVITFFFPSRSLFHWQYTCLEGALERRPIKLFAIIS